MANDIEKLGEIMDNIIDQDYLEDRGQYDVDMLQKMYGLTVKDAIALQLLIAVEMCRKPKR